MNKAYEARHRHALYYSSVLRTANDLYDKGHEKVKQGMDQFELELDNIRNGQAWAANNANQDDESARICITYSTFSKNIVHLRLHVRERILWFEKASELAHRLKNLHYESVALHNLGRTHLLSG